MPLPLLSSTSTTLPNVVGALGLFAGGVGVASLLYPRKGIEAFGLKPVADRDGMKLVEGAWRVYGIRNLTMGLNSLAIWYIGRGTTGPERQLWNKIVGLTSILAIGIPLVDGWVCEEQTGRGGWAHWGFAPISAVFGAALLGWFDGLGV